MPVLVDLKPSGIAYMAEFHDAGGVPRLLSEIADVLDAAAPTVAGTTIGEIVAARPAALRGPRSSVAATTRWCRSAPSPCSPATLRPRGAVIKHSAASPELQQHEGRAVVFESVEDMTLRLDDAATEIAADDVLVLRNAGPRGAPGMPEAGYIPIPRRLARQGVKDMVRISDARMSGTAFGTVILHVTPEAAAGGPLAVVRTGDRIRLDVPARRLELLVGADELAARLVARDCPAEAPARGYARLFDRHVLQADEGLDFDFLQGRRRWLRTAPRRRSACRPGHSTGRRAWRCRPAPATAISTSSATACRSRRSAATRHAWRRSPTGAPSPPPSASHAASSCSRASTAPTTAPSSKLWPRIPTPCAASSSFPPTPPAPKSPACTVLGVRGVRINLLNRAGLGLDAIPDLARLVRPFGWHLQLLVGPGQIAEVAALAALHAMPVVVDHLAMIRPGDAGAAVTELQRLLDTGEAYVKLSAPYRLAQAPGCPGIARLVARLVRSHPERLLWGTDWPHTDLYESVPDDADLVETALDWLPDPALRQRVLVANPQALYWAA